jgi:hypothetical protein
MACFLRALVSTVGFGASTANAKTVTYVDDDALLGACLVRREVEGQRGERGARCTVFEPLPSL